MQFFKPEYFLLLWLVPAVLIFYVFSKNLWKKRLQRLVRDEALLSKLIEGYRKGEWLVHAILMTLVVLCFVVALARPQWGDEKRTAQRKGVDLIFMVDTSLSMLAEDIKPNRIEKAKFEIETFVRNLHGDRIGMVTFAGSGFLQTPLTLDHAAFLLFLDAVQVGFLPDPGTSLVQAVHLAIRAFPQKELKYKALILFTDGEDHEGSIEQIIEEAKQANVRIYCIGLGTAEGEPIPLKNERGERSGFKKDRNGQMVLTKLNQPLLERIAKETGGIYLPATPGEKEVDVILKHLRGWGEQQFAEKAILEREDQYQIFLVLAFILLIAEMLVRRKKNRKGPALMACLAVFFLFTGFLETSKSTVKKGNEHYQNKQYQSALEAYRKVQVKHPDAPEVLYDLGTALYKVDSFQESAQDLDAAVQKTKDPKLKALALYNKGNAQYRLGNFEGAMDAYKKALELDPGDKDAKYNLEFLQNKKNKMDKKDQEQKKDDQKKQDQKQDSQKNNQNQQQNQGQGQQDQKSQGQQGKDNQDQNQQSQGQKDQQNQDQQNQDQKDQQSNEQKNQQNQGQQQKEQEQQQKEQERKDKEAEQQKQQQQSQSEQNDQEQKEQEKKDQQEQQQKEQEQKDQQEQQQKAPKEGQGQQKRPLQGQMSMDNALNLLDALKESEKELQDLRRPPVNKNPPPVDKDW